MVTVSRVCTAANLGADLPRPPREGPRRGAERRLSSPGCFGHPDAVTLPFSPPVPPMLAKLSTSMPEGDGWLFEPKWDGFRVLVWRDGDEVYLQSRDEKPLNRYFPELLEPLRRQLPPQVVLDGEIVIAGPRGLEFEALLLRIHPAASRVAMLAEQAPASVVFWDLLAEGGEDLREVPLGERRRRLEAALSHAQAPVHLTPATQDRNLALQWFARFEGAGLDGVVAKRLEGSYQPGQRAMVKVKHQRTADCVVAGFRWHKNAPGTQVGSLLLGIYDAAGTLQHVGVCASFTVKRRAELVTELAPLRTDALANHPWRHWQIDPAEINSRMPGGTSRWNRGKDLSWEPVRPELVCEVSYDHLQGSRFRHGTHFQRWRPDKTPADCRYDQLETTTPFELQEIFKTPTTDRNQSREAPAPDVPQPG
jgi:ATP-dependent DNA ligase